MAAENINFESPRGWRLAGRYLLLAGIAVVVLFPVYTTVIGALKPGNEVLQHPLVPGPFTLDGFSEAWTAGPPRQVPPQLVRGRVRHHHRPTRDRAALGVRVRDDRLPRTRPVVRRVPRHAAGAARDDARRQPPDRRLARLAELVPGPGGAVHGDGLRHVPAATSVHRAARRPPRRRRHRRRRAPRLPPPRRDPTRAADARGAGAVQLPRRAGTSTCGRT